MEMDRVMKTVAKGRRIVIGAMAASGAILTLIAGCGDAGGVSLVEVDRLQSELTKWR
jgi:hypothetical protein